VSVLAQETLARLEVPHLNVTVATTAVQATAIDEQFAHVSAAL